MPNSKETWVGGDGGPLVVIQAGALQLWRGAADFMQSRMNGGSLETDYDVICECRDYHVKRHGRDMLVLDDCEWSGRIFGLENGVIVVEQPYYSSEEFPDVVQQVSMSQPKLTFPMVVEDDRLRLLVGADTSDGNTYGFSEIEVVPGPKRCEVYLFDNRLAILISPG